ncbi:uncharacterized protein LOC141613760 [Silene latifolia]|uniref:uncharacterized protein LOC141613760 n=1 Tax=Silene latifolia TaxID=37657 RepID=UPI003D77F55A
MTKKSNNSPNVKHHIMSKKSNTSSVIESEKETLVGRPNIEEGLKHKNIHDITGILPFQLHEIQVEDVEEESEPKQEEQGNDEEGEWYQRFHTEEMKQAVLDSGHFLFDNKPLIIKSWMPDIELEKEEIKNVPAWIRLHGLPLKFWGNSLPKLANLVGKYVKSGTATDQKTKLGFARVVVELQLGHKFPDKIKFMDEKNRVVHKLVQLIHSTGTPEIKQQQDISSTVNEAEVTPKTIPIPLAIGTMSPVRLTKATRHGLDDMGRSTQVSLTYMEVLSGQSTHKEGVYGLIETKVKASSINKTMNNVFKDWSISSNNAQHQGGRIWVLWKPHMVDILFLEYAAQYIHMQVLDKVSRFHFHYTIVYAFNGPSRRGLLTWNNKQPPETRKYSRLDRFLVNAEWISVFPDLFAMFLPEGLFDHNPCVVCKDNMDRQRNIPFKYFNMWSSTPQFQTIVTEI